MNVPSAERLAQGAPPWRRLLALALLCAAIVLVVIFDASHRALLDLLARAEPVIARHPVPGALLFVALSALSAMLAFLSSAVLVPVAVVAWGPGTTILLLWVGWLVGGMGSYGIARLLGRAVVRRLLSREALERYERWITPRLPFRLVLLLQLALPSEAPGYLLGLARYSFGKYMLALALVELPFAIGLVYIGQSLVDRHTMILVVLAGVGLLVTGVALWRLHLRLAEADPRPRD